MSDMNLTWISKANERGELVHEADGKATGAAYRVESWFGEGFTLVVNGTDVLPYSFDSVLDAKASCQRYEDALAAERGATCAASK